MFFSHALNCFISIGLLFEVTSDDVLNEYIYIVLNTGLCGAYLTTHSTHFIYCYMASDIW